MNRIPNRWALAWAALTVAFALHVLDEATNDFLSWYNPIAADLRRRLGQDFFPPVFTFPIWLGGLCAAILLLGALTPLLRMRRPWLIALAYAYAAIHLLNGVVHISVSIANGFIAPGALSSPILLAAALWLLVETNAVRRQSAGAALQVPAPTS